jgi:uncharacterized membrane-anchored protein YhcB (DUF1043 family)
MDDYLLFILGLVVGYWVGKIVTNALNTISFREILKDLNVNQSQLEQLRAQLDTDDEVRPLPQLEIRIEQQGTELYAYRCDNDQFLGQGPDREALIKRLTENLTNVRVIVSKEHGADLIR